MIEGTPHSDVPIVQRAHDLVSLHPYFRGTSHIFKFDYRDHVLTVSGDVETYYLKQVLQSGIAQLCDNVRIDNRVTVRPRQS